MSNAAAYKAHIDAVKAQMPRIVRLRKEAGLTYRQIAKRFDVSENFIKTLFRTHENVTK